MTRQHFKYIADSLKGTRPEPQCQALSAQWNYDVEAMASVCRHFSANFKRERFLDACGGLIQLWPETKEEAKAA